MAATDQTTEVSSDSLENLAKTVEALTETVLEWVIHYWDRNRYHRPDPETA